MKLMTLFMLVIIGAASAHGYSQPVELSLNLSNVTISQVFIEIEKNSDFILIYNEKELNINRQVSVKAENESIETVLRQVLDGTGNYFNIYDRQIVIFKLNEIPVSDIIGNIDIQQPQKKVITGTITDENGNPLPGVNVQVEGTTVGAISDAGGKYSIDIPNDNAVLVFSFIGYNTQRIPVSGKTTIDMTLVPGVASLEEVVVVGYGTQKKTTLTGSVASVKGADLVESQSINVSNSIVGRLPGVIAVTRSGEPGADGATIRVRGLNTFGNNNALIVVDGVSGRSLERIDPNSIESISVLKDASAAIYGSQAANGVILVTTKRGVAGKPKVAINLNQGFSQPTRVPKLTNAAEYATALNEVNTYRGTALPYTAQDIQKFSDGSDPWKYPNTDWFGATFKEWSQQSNADVSISGGTEFIRYFISGGAKSQDGFYKNSATKYNQYNFRTNLDADVNKYISIGFDISGRQEDRNYPNRSTSNILAMLMRGKPTEPAYWPNGKPGPDIEFGDNPVVITTNQTGYDRTTTNVLNSNLKLNIKIPWIKGLSMNANAAFDKYVNFNKEFTKPWYLYTWDEVSYDENNEPILISAKRGIDQATLYENISIGHSLQLNGFIRYDKTMADVHNIKILAGVEKIEGKGDYLNAYRGYFESVALDELNAGGTNGIKNGGGSSNSTRLNYFGRVNYDYKAKYLAEFVWRYDGSYIFPESGQFGFFPGVSLGWRLSEENFWKNNLAFINNFKLRGSYGQSGNDRINEWQYLSSYAYNSRNNNRIFNINEEFRGLYESRIPNEKVTWEVANQADIGFDAGFFNNKLSVTFDYFDYRRSKILWWRNASVPATTGLTLPRENIGKVTNRGYDFAVDYKDQAGNFKYQVSINGGYAKNKITFWDESPGVPEYQRSTGRPMPSDPGNSAKNLYYQAIGIFKDQAALDAYPHWTGAQPGDIIFKDVSGDGVIDGNDRVRSEKNDMPTFQGGLGVRLQYRQFDLSALMQGSAGGECYISVLSGEYGNYLKDDYNGRWTTDNTDASKPRSSNRVKEYWKQYNNTYFLHKTDYIRLKNVELGYNLPATLNSKMGIQGLRVYVSGMNLLTFCPDLKDFDPEDNSGQPSGITTTGTVYYLPKTLNFGISVTF